MLIYARLLNYVASGVFCAAIAATSTIVPSFGVKAVAGSGLVLVLSVAADDVKAGPRAGNFRRPATRPNRPVHRHPHVHPRPGAAPRRHNYYRKERYDDWRDYQRRRHFLGFLYVATLPRGCTTTVILDDGIRYYSCSGIYYRPYVDNGTTIYVVRE